MSRHAHSVLRQAIAFIAIGVLSVLQGCGGAAHTYDAVVTGTVTVDGELAKTGTVTFHPAKEGRAAIGRIYPDGSYSLRTGQGDLSHSDGGTLSSGEYLVTASVTKETAKGDVVSEGGPPKPGPSLIDKKYAQKDTTDLRFTVKPGEQVIVLDLKSAAPDASAETPATPSGETNEEPKGENSAAIEKESSQEKKDAAPVSEHSTPEPQK
jgi:hypothetical protein